MLLTPEETARILGLSPFTVRRLLREGVLPGRKVGKRQWRILRADLDDYLGASDTRQTRQPEPPGRAWGRIEELAAEQGVLPVSDFDSLLGETWPEDEGEGESVEEFIAEIHALRENSQAQSAL